jgi:acetoin utilization deacetylase AcuC-like enzyme
MKYQDDCTKKRFCKSLREGSRKTADLRQLIVVCDKKAKFEVQARQQVKKVPLTHLREGSYAFPTVRRNKKILKVMQMLKDGSKSNKTIHVVTSQKKGLSEIESLYGHDVVQVLKNPGKFDFHREKDSKELWNITKKKSSSVIMQADWDQIDFHFLRDPLERDLGVLKTSVEKLLANRAHDVVAVNTHPGHHAGPKRAMNYCTLNNIAIAAQLLKEARPSLQLGVLDLDVHPGDGTQEFVEQHRHLIKKYVSIHCTTKFMNMNSSLGSNGAGLRLDKECKVVPERFIAKIAEVLTAWNRERLDVIIVAMGFDTLKRDPFKVGFQMLPVHFRDIGYMLAQQRQQLFFVQEGGYNLNETARAFDYLIKGLQRGRGELSS